MESKNGYKLTDVGVIPNEWHAERLDHCVSPGAPICYGILMPGEHCDGGVPVIKVRDILRGRIDESNLLLTRPSIDEAYKRSRLCSGDVLITIRGTTGRVAIVPKELQGANITQDTARVRVNPQKSNEFVYYALQTEIVQQQVALHTIGQAVKGINIRDVKNLIIPSPERPAEQRAIAEALGDADALLASLDRLIVKKRDLKQAAMQQLLTGETRLPGFDCEWKEKPLGELFTFSGGYSASRDQLSAEGRCYLHYGDIHGSTKVTVDVSADYQIIPKLDVPLSRIGGKSMLQDGDVVFVDASEDDEGASRHVVVVNKENIPFISGLHTIVAKSKTDELAHEYRCYCFQTAAIRQQFLFYAVGTKVTGISKTNIGRIKLNFPCVREQTAIAEVLIDMDEELMALETRRTKTVDLKWAMMQELLTGKTRLI